jgi:hypothetical protein
LPFLLIHQPPGAGTVGPFVSLVATTRIKHQQLTNIFILMNSEMIK